MSINFSKDRWPKVKQAWGKFWEGNLDRPNIAVYLSDAPTSHSEPELPESHFTSQYDQTITPEQIVDRWDYNLSRTEFLGDAFPNIFPNFGPGVIAEFIGAIAEQGETTVWFHPKKEFSIDELNFELNFEHPTLNRISNLMTTAIDRWEGLVQMNMTDLGGNLDILATFLPSEKLLFDLYDNPDKVKSLTSQIDRIWEEYYNHFNKILRPVNPGYSSWASLFCEEPYYMLQCDFCYMIGPDMFDQFIKPAIEREANYLTHSFYHLDGPGQLVHLDSLLSIEKLDGIQWVPGAGNETTDKYTELYQRILDAGKRVQIVECPSTQTLDRIFDKLNTLSGVQVNLTLPYEEKDKVSKWLEQYGIKNT